MTARTAAELREAFIEGVLDELPPQSMFRKVNPNSVGKLDELLAAARAEAVAPVMDVLRQLASAWAVRCQCITCNSHREPSPARRIDPSLRAALALLAADQAGEKAGKP